MSDFKGPYQKWISGCIGKELSVVKGLIYVFDAPDFNHPQQLQLVFGEGGEIAKFRCGSNGSRLEISYSPLKEKELGEYGKEVIIDLSGFPMFINCIGKILLKACLIYSLMEDDCVGIKLLFEGDYGLLIMNVGDEINVLDCFSLSYEQEEGLEYYEL